MTLKTGVTALKSELQGPGRSQVMLTGEGLEESSLPTMLVKRNLRSGQCVQYRGNVVIVGDVNAGAEIYAEGNVIVLGQLRGLVQAGAKGDRRAVVVAFKLCATQLRIAGIIAAPQISSCANNRPEIARIQDEIVVIESL